MMAVSQSWKQIRIDPTVLPTSSSAEQHRVNSGDWKILEVGLKNLTSVWFKMFKSATQFFPNPFRQVFVQNGLICPR